MNKAPLEDSCDREVGLAAYREACPTKKIPRGLSKVIRPHDKVDPWLVMILEFLKTIIVLLV